MNNKTNIEEDINILNEIKYQLQVRNKQIENDIYDNEIFASQYEERNEQIRAIENLLADRERLQEENETQSKQLNDAFTRGFIHKDEIKDIQVKANKYNSLVEKIKKDIEEYPEAKYTKYYLLDCLELLDTEKGE